MDRGGGAQWLDSSLTCVAWCSRRDYRVKLVGTCLTIPAALAAPDFTHFSARLVREEGLALVGWCCRTGVARGRRT